MKTNRRTSTVVFNKIKIIPRHVSLDDLNESGLFVSQVEIKRVKAAVKKGKNRIRWLSRSNKNNQIDHDVMIDVDNNIYAIYNVGENNAIGTGRYGFVRLAQEVKHGEWLALKCTRDSEKFIQREVGTLQAMNNLRGFTMGPDKITAYILSPFAFGDKLSSLIKRKDLFQPVQYLKVAYNAMKALGKMHYANVVHRDIKPNNMIVDVAMATVSFIDYGFAGMGKRNERDILQCEGVRMGTVKYMSPEISIDAKLRPYSERSDLYALGVALAKWFGLDLVYDGNALTEVRQGEKLKAIFKTPALCEMVRQLICKMTESDPDKRINLLTAETAIRKIYAALGYTPITDTRVALINVAEYQQLSYAEKKEMKKALKAFDQIMLISPTEQRVKSIDYSLLHHAFEADGFLCMDQYVTFRDYRDLAEHIDRRLNLEVVSGYYHCCYLTTRLPNQPEIRLIGNQVVCVAPYKDVVSYQDDILRTYLNKAVKSEDKKKLVQALNEEKKKMVAQALRCKALNQSNIEKITTVIKTIHDDPDLNYAVLYNLIGKLKRDLGYAVLTANQPMWAPAIQERVNMTSALLDAMMPAQRLAP